MQAAGQSREMKQSEQTLLLEQDQTGVETRLNHRGSLNTAICVLIGLVFAAAMWHFGFINRLNTSFFVLGTNQSHVAGTNKSHSDGAIGVVKQRQASCCLVDNSMIYRGGQASCCLVENSTIYLGGDDLAPPIRGVKSEAACCALCQTNSECTGWSFGKVHLKPYGGLCFLKHQEKFSRVQDHNFISGLPDSEDTLSFQIKAMKAQLCLTATRAGPVMMPCIGDGDIAGPAAEADEDAYLDTHSGRWRARLRSGKQAESDPMTEVVGIPKSPNSTQLWRLSRSLGLIRSSVGNLCLTAAPSNKDGAPVTLNTCDPKGTGGQDPANHAHASQGWFFDGLSGLLIHEHSNMCIDMEDPLANVSLLKMGVCHREEPKYTFAMWDSKYLQTRATLEAMRAVLSTPLSPTSIFCWSLVMPVGYEPQLVQAQYAKRIGIFSCDEWAIYSDRPGLIPGIRNGIVKQDMACPYGGEFNTAMNRQVFFNVWHQMMKDGRWRHHTWTIKLDPDTVINLSVLRSVLGGLFHLTTNHSNHRGVFLNNCWKGLHGPIEVLSSNAVNVFHENFLYCNSTLRGELPGQEDVALELCLKKLHVYEYLETRLLAEANCQVSGWDTCIPGYASYHPWKEFNWYANCTLWAEGLLPRPTTTTTTTMPSPNTAAESNAMAIEANLAMQ